MEFKEYLTLLKNDKYGVLKPFELHIPKRCASNLNTDPTIVLLGKIYTDDGKAFDLTQCTTSKTGMSSYDEEDDRFILYYKEGDIFCDKSVPRSISNQEVVTKLLMGGQMLEDLEYQSVYDAVIHAVRNNQELDVPNFYYEYTVASMIRDAKDGTKMLRQSGPTAPFKSMSVNQINMRADAFTAITTTDIETMIIAALDAKEGAPETPIKKTFLM